MGEVIAYTTQGVDEKAAPLATADPLPSGSPSAGIAGTAARGDHVHPHTADPDAYPIFGEGDWPTSDSLYQWTRPLGMPNGWGPIEDVKGPCTPFPVYEDMLLHHVMVWSGRSAGAGGQGKFAIFKRGLDGDLHINQAPIWTSPAFSVAQSQSTPVGPAVNPAGHIFLPRGMYWLAVLSYSHSGTRFLPSGFGHDQWGSHFYPTAGPGHWQPGMQVVGLNETDGTIPASAPYVSIVNNQNTLFPFLIGASRVN